MVNIRTCFVGGHLENYSPESIKKIRDKIGEIRPHHLRMSDIGFQWGRMYFDEMYNGDIEIVSSRDMVNEHLCSDAMLLIRKKDETISDEMSILRRMFRRVSKQVFVVTIDETS